MDTVNVVIYSLMAVGALILFLGIHMWNKRSKRIADAIMGQSKATAPRSTNPML